MSGIFGLWRLDGQAANRDDLRRMSDVLAYRGPDGERSWSEGSVGLGHRMLRTTPESLHERQPLVARAGELVLSADARIDNREELITALELRGRSPTEVTDSELLLGAYERWGEECPGKLLGDFAFVVWDEARRTLFCARDHFGVKPLYYFHAPGRLFAFASGIKALLTLPEVTEEINELEVARHFLVPVYEDLGSTYYRDVRRVLPGEALVVSAQGIRRRQYWSLDPERSLKLSSDGEYAEAVREAFIQAVRCRLRANGQISSMLSGGLDSSSVTSVASWLLEKNGSGRLHTLSALYEDIPETDERQFINEVLERYDVEPHFFLADQTSPVAEMDRMNWLGDGANWGGNLYLNWNLYRIASDAGSRVVLDGYDGDSTLSHGRGHLLELAHARRWLALTIEVKSWAQRIGEPWPRAVRAWIMTYGVKPRARLILRRRRRGVDRVPLGPLGTDWVRGLDERFSRRILHHIAPPRPKERTDREHHHRLMTRPILLDSLRWVEAIGAGAGVEARFPFFDVRFVQLCLSLPPNQKLRDGWSRYVMREAMKDILPEKIRWRAGKSDISPGFYHALRAHARISLENVIRNAEDRLSEYVDPEFVRALYPQFMAGTVSESEQLFMWRIFSFALWLNGKAAERSPLAELPAAAER